MRLLNLLPPERAHHLAIAGLKHGLVPDHRGSLPDNPVTVAGLVFPNPIGLAAGFDKNAEALPGLAKLGFGFLEVGTVTPRPQPGNPSPRLFRLPPDRALVNRLGFNNKGAAFMQRQLERLPATIRTRCRIGVNLGKNKDQPDAIADYVAGVTAFAGLADYLTINVSSPNTPGLRTLQSRGPLQQLLEAALNARARTGHAPPLFLKVAPDLSQPDIEDIAAVALDTKIDGLIVSNTTLSRPDTLQHPHGQEAGGLSGAPLTRLAGDRLRQFAHLLGGQMPLIGVGGIMTVEDARERLAAGATLLQTYTGFIYGGAGFAAKLVKGLANTEKLP